MFLGTFLGLRLITNTILELGLPSAAFTWEGNSMKRHKNDGLRRYKLVAERARLTVELARRRLDSPPCENVIARDEQPPMAVSHQNLIG